MISGQVGAVMYILKIEHAVLNFDGWKKAFDSDPIGRRKSGVKTYRVMRSRDNTNHVMVDLEFESATQAEALHAGRRTVWDSPQGKAIKNPKAVIAELVEMSAF